MVDHTKISEFRVVATSFVVDVLDVVLNLTIALFTGSVVMLSEFFQGLADLTASGFLLVGHKRAKKKPDKLHPFGHGKEIYYWTLISGVVMMTITATASIYFGLDRVLHPQPIAHIEFGFLVLFIAFFTNGYALSLSVKRLLEDKPLRQITEIFLRSNTVATKNALVLDLMGTLASFSGFISLLLSYIYGETRFDGIGAIGIGVITGVLAFILVVGVRGFLIGKRADVATEKKIKEAALSIPEVQEVLDLRTMQIGTDQLLVNMEVHMKDRLTTDQLEVLIDKIKVNVREQVPEVSHIQVELETPL